MDDHPVNLFDSTISALSRSMDLRARQHEMLLGNIANADTPNYKPFSMDVEKAMQNHAPPTQSGDLVRTDAHHLRGIAVSDESEEMDTAEDNPLLLRGDGNGVDIDAQMTELAKNSMLYKVSAQIAKSKFKGLKYAITGGTR